MTNLIPRAIALLSLALSVACVPHYEDTCFERKGLGNSDGGYSDSDLDSDYVNEIAAWATETITDEPDAPYELLCAREQVVAGTNYRLGIEVDELLYHVEVYEDLQGDLWLEEVEELD